MTSSNLSGDQMIFTIGISKAPRLRSTKTAGMVCIFLLSLVLHGEHAASTQSVTVTFVDPEWSHDLTEHTVVADDRLKDFTQETGIGVRHLPTPETASDQLDLIRKLLQEGNCQSGCLRCRCDLARSFERRIDRPETVSGARTLVDQRRRRRQLHGQGKTGCRALSFRSRSSVLPKGFAAKVWVHGAAPYVGRTRANGSQDPEWRARQRAKRFLGIYMARCRQAKD